MRVWAAKDSRTKHLSVEKVQVRFTYWDIRSIFGAAKVLAQAYEYDCERWQKYKIGWRYFICKWCLENWTDTCEKKKETKPLS